MKEKVPAEQAVTRQERPLPARVQEALGELVGAAKEGWTFYKPPGPMMAQSTPGEGTTADLHYYIWVDRFNASGLGKDSVILNGTNSDSLQIFNQTTNKWVTMRVPYPLNAYQRGLDGRIDDPKTGWKGRGLWFNDGLDPVIHNEVQHGWLGHAQFRPNPLAR